MYILEVLKWVMALFTVIKDAYIHQIKMKGGMKENYS